MQKMASDCNRPGRLRKRQGVTGNTSNIAGGDRLQGGLAAIRCGGLCSVQPDGQPQSTDRKSRRNAARPASAGGGRCSPSLPYQRNIIRSRNTLAKGRGARGGGKRGEVGFPPPRINRRFERFESQKRDSKTIFFEPKNEHLFL